MLKFTKLALRRGTKELFHDVTLTIHAGQKVGITGGNGVGKSSLFSLIRGQLHADSGDVSFPKNIKTAHVAQETPALEQVAIEYVLDGDIELRQLENKIKIAEEKDDGEALAHYYSEMESIGGYSANSHAATLLHGLGFTSAQEQLSVKSFSGGWRMRLNLAQALIRRSDMLLLDEPTNHLDLDAVIWLENWLRQYKGTLLLISHDRDFLDNVTTHIAHVEHSQINYYTGNYSAFELRRAEQLATQQSAFEKQQREIQHMHKFVERFKAKATKARQAQSRVKALERMEIIAPAHVDSPFKFQFKTAEKIPNPLLNLNKVNAGYQDTTILNQIKFTVHPGDRIGLLGHNGAGKSTLIKLLANEIQPQQGELHFAKELKTGYFAQHQLEQLDDEASPLLHLQRIDKKATESDLRKFLGGFAFNNDMALDPVAPLSGGEKARLVLALLVYQKPNLLLLDEPTNHLDLEMRHALTIAMQSFEGAMIIVSHDRHLLRTVTDTLLLVSKGTAEPFDGDLDDYKQWINNENKLQKQNKERKTIPDAVNSSVNNADKRAQQKPLQNKLKKLDKQLEQLTTKKTNIESGLADDSNYKAENKETLNHLLAEQTEINTELERVETEWMEISEALQNLKG
ncbi:Bis-ABC ATPase YheS [hydrothermal vent metagenome]|uniref:Bis-ABC ATPase YheS n=1 Tax=hydrothermal vent metagenome TaxID=652676 RepID=A0A3B1AVM6_9ZZZZ